MEILSVIEKSSACDRLDFLELSRRIGTRLQVFEGRACTAETTKEVELIVQQIAFDYLLHRSQDQGRC